MYVIWCCKFRVRATFEVLVSNNNKSKRYNTAPNCYDIVAVHYSTVHVLDRNSLDHIGDITSRLNSAKLSD